jgi:hypothetical protein
MSRQSKRELIEKLRPKYLAADKKGKGEILDMVVYATGYHRKYAIALLRHGYPRRRHNRRKRPVKYNQRVVNALIRIWRAFDCICERRLHPFLAEAIGILERHRELNLDIETKTLLLEMSESTMGRKLRQARPQHPRRSLSTTKRSARLKGSIPLRTFSHGDMKRPGLFEVDLVAHCGRTVRGEFIHTLDLVDIYTGWNECVAILNRGQKAVVQALDRVRMRLPFPVLALDTDNGSEFLNAHLVRYCAAEQITFTRSRPYKKNDQAHVEQKNGAVVRRWIGYARYEKRTAMELMNDLYELLRIYNNFFQPSVKLIRKTRRGSKVVRQYDKAATPYQRLVACVTLDGVTSERLREVYRSLNPAQLRRELQGMQERVWDASTEVMALVRS